MDQSPTQLIVDGLEQAGYSKESAWARSSKPASYARLTNGPKRPAMSIDNSSKSLQEAKPPPPPTQLVPQVPGFKSTTTTQCSSSSITEIEIWKLLNQQQQQQEGDGVYLRYGWGRLRRSGGGLIGGAQHTGAQVQRGQDHGARFPQANRRQRRARRQVQNLTFLLLLIDCGL